MKKISCPICNRYLKMVDDGESYKHLECQDCGIRKDFKSWEEQREYEKIYCVDLPKINGKVDTESVADMIVTHILSQSIAKYHNNYIFPDEKKELEEYVKDILDSML